MNEAAPEAQERAGEGRVPRPIHAVLIFIFAIGASLIAGVLVGIIVELAVPSFDPTGAMDPVDRQFLNGSTIIITVLVLIGVLALFMRQRHFQIAATLHWRRYSRVGPYVLGVIAALAIAVVWDRLVGELVGLIPALSPGPSLLNLIQSSQLTNIPMFGAYALLVGLGPGIGEELIFRGFILRGFLSRYGPAVAVLLSGLLFALFHFDPVHMLAVFPIGLWLGYVVVRTGSIYPAVAVHVGINVMSTVEGAVWQAAVPGVEARDIAFGLGYPPIVIGVALVIAIGGVMGFHRLTATDRGVQEDRAE